jgi:hypothetical protein
MSTTEMLTSALAFVGMLYLATKMVLAIIVYWQAAHYDEVVTKDEPVVRAQVDAYSAEQERARRSHISDLAEQAAGSPVNLNGEKRLVAERMGHAPEGSSSSVCLGQLRVWFQSRKPRGERWSRGQSRRTLKQ